MEKTKATQVFTTNKVCWDVTRFDPVGVAIVNGENIEPLNGSLYISNAVLALLGNPKSIVITVEATK